MATNQTAAPAALLPDATGAVLIAWLGESDCPQGWWPNADADAFREALVAQELAEGRSFDDRDGDDEVEPHQSLVAYLDALSIVTVEAEDAA